MRIRPLFAICCIAAGVLSTSATAQKVFKCGNSYSQSPCPDAVAIDTADQRTAAQKAQTDQASRRDAEVARAMEKARLDQERKSRSVKVPAPRKHASAPAGQKAVKHVTRKKKIKESAYFTAKVPVTKTSHPASTKSKAKDDASKP